MNKRKRKVLLTRKIRTGRWFLAPFWDGLSSDRQARKASRRLPILPRADDRGFTSVVQRGYRIPAGPMFANEAGRGLHIPGYNYCGPFTQLRGQRPTCALDDACRHHDYAYSRARGIEDFRAANEELSRAAFSEGGVAGNMVGAFFTAFPDFPRVKQREEL